MITNCSVPANIILPHIVYENVVEAIAWLTKTLGFVEHYRYGDPVSGAQLHLGDAWIMVRQGDQDYKTPAKLGYGTQSLTVFTEDVDSHFHRTKVEGAKIVEELHETEYGERQYGVQDLTAITGCLRSMRATWHPSSGEQRSPSADSSRRKLILYNQHSSSSF